MKKNQTYRRVWKISLLFIAVLALLTACSQVVNPTVVASTYTITITDLTGGNIATSSLSAKNGDIVTITVTTDYNKGLKDNTLKANEEIINTKYNPSGKYTFEMPSENVTLSAEFGDTFNLKIGTNLNNMFNLDDSNETKDITKFVYSAKSKYETQIQSWTNMGSACEDDSDKAIMYLNGTEAYLLTDDVGLTRANPDCENLFDNCNVLANVDLSSFDTSLVTNMNGMFSSCSKIIKFDLSNFDTSKVEKMYAMFSGCIELTRLDLSSFDTRYVTDMRSMFSFCYAITTIYVSPNFIIDSLDLSLDQNMFYWNNNLKAKRYEGSGEVNFDENKISKEMAKIATATVDGYFTDSRLKP